MTTMAMLILSLASIVLVSTSAQAFPFGPLPFSTPWDSFHNLTGCQAGDHNPSLPDLKSYLTRFGYLPSTTNLTDSFDDDLAAAILAYQQNFGLNATGSLDDTTIAQLVAPRCGVADVINGTNTMGSHDPGRKLFTYFPNSPSWPPSRRALTYALTSISTVSIPEATLKSVFASAFSRWAAATKLTFTEVADGSEADITIGFYGGDHGDGEPFDGVLGTLAHAFSPTDGRFHLDSAEDWVADGDVSAASSSSAVDLESVAVHEIGHLLGLGHSSVAESIMYPTIRTRTKKVELDSDDVAGIQGLYGQNPSFVGKSSPASTPSTTTAQERNDGVGLTGRGWWRGCWSLLVVVVVGLFIL